MVNLAKNIRYKKTNLLETDKIMHVKQNNSKKWLKQQEPVIPRQFRVNSINGKTYIPNSHRH